LLRENARVRLTRVSEQRDVADPFELAGIGPAPQGQERALLSGRLNAVLELDQHFTGQIVEFPVGRFEELGDALGRHHRKLSWFGLLR
jgi:hypothetical protein